ncbi:MaoC/PaaZ C-terminal domain-containing protein [Streptomyces sp. NPDC007861]|uniref:MaoC family dehydratase n=1 Tax=Streptomyces sp. NPDC007861 TaxID=3154893 RepID=UPI0033C9CE6A
MDTTRTLAAPPPLGPALLRGALASPLKRRVRDGAALPQTRLVVPAAAVDAGRLAAYARVCGFSESGALPLTYPHVLGFPLAIRLMAGRAFPLPLLGLVHTYIEITRHRPLLPTDAPTLCVYAAGLTPHRRGTEVTMVTEARLGGETGEGDEGDELVWESRSRYLHRHARTDAVRTTTPSPSSPSPSPSPSPEATVGTTTAQARWPLPADLGRRYAAASGDRNPIHLYALTARAFGFRRAVAHGMWTFARCLAEQPHPGGIAYAEAEFRAPVLLPGTVEYAVGEEADESNEGDGGVFELRDPRNGRVHLIGRTATTARPA